MDIIPVSIVEDQDGVPPKWAPVPIVHSTVFSTRALQPMVVDVASFIAEKNIDDPGDWDVWTGYVFVDSTGAKLAAIDVARSQLLLDDAMRSLVTSPVARWQDNRGDGSWFEFDRDDTEIKISRWRQPTVRFPIDVFHQFSGRAVRDLQDFKTSLQGALTQTKLWRMHPPELQEKLWKR
jgi:hypothetical protein